MAVGRHLLSPSSAFYLLYISYLLECGRQGDEETTRRSYKFLVLFIPFPFLSPSGRRIFYLLLRRRPGDGDERKGKEKFL